MDQRVPLVLAYQKPEASSKRHVKGMLAQDTFAWCWVCAPAPPPLPTGVLQHLHHTITPGESCRMSYQQGELHSLHGVALSLAFLLPLGFSPSCSPPSCPPCHKLPLPSGHRLIFPFITKWKAEASGSVMHWASQQGFSNISKRETFSGYFC